MPVSGICGIYICNDGEQVPTPFVSAMAAALDADGETHSRMVTLPTIALGVKSGKRCPSSLATLSVHGSSLAIAFYGNLYGVEQLLSPEELERTHDLGVRLLHLYLRNNLAFVQRLRGEFVFALWDGREEKAHLVTDRFRVHPLFYYHDHAKVVFASSMKALLACPLMKRPTINPQAIVDVVASSIIPTPKTIFREVRKLPPGHIVTCSARSCRVEPYWDIQFQQSRGADQHQLSQHLKAQLTDAVSIRLAEDRCSDDIGTFLSGGVDSSTITGLVTRLTHASIKSFSIGFGEAQFNEMSYARIAARAFSARHYEYVVTPRDVVDAIPTLLENFDEPFANASAIPTYFCAKLAAAHGVDVLYAGDGGDELFAGNERYAVQRLFDYYHMIPSVLREALLKPLVFTSAALFPWTPLINGAKYIRRASIPYPERLSSYGFFMSTPLADFLSDSLIEAVGKSYDPYALVNAYYYQAPTQDELHRQLYIDLKLAMTDNDVIKVTRMTKAAGVAVRFPFLDHHVVDFAMTIPAPIKMRGRKLRSFFKQAYADLLPIETRRKQKHGFGLPIPMWLRADQSLNDLMHDLLLSPRSLQRGYFRRSALEQLLDRHKSDTGSYYGTILWNLMVLELWQRASTQSLVQNKL